MADENEKPGLDPQPRRRVPPPTIDLQATDVSAPADPAAQAESQSKSGSPPPGDPPAGDANDADKAAPDEPAPDRAEPPEPRPERRFAGVGTAAAGAALALIAAGAAWMVFGPNAARREPADAVAARLSRLEAQFAALPKSAPAPTPVPAPAPATVDPKALAALDRRLGEVETALAHPAPAPPPPADPALADLRRRLDETAAAARAAQQRADAAAKAAAEAAQAARAPAPQDGDNTAARADLDALSSRLARIESDEKALADRLAKTESRSESKSDTESAAANAASTTASAADATANAASATANAASATANAASATATAAANAAARASASAGDSRAAVAALALALTVERGGAYGRELAAIDQKRADKSALDALGALAQSGVPSASVLARELVALIPAARAAAEPPAPEGGLIDRLKADAARLVRVRPIGAPAGDAPPAVLARLETAAAHDDLAAARAEAEKLPPAARAPLEPWIKRVAQREAALNAASALVAHALDALRTSSVEGAPSR